MEIVEQPFRGRRDRLMRARRLDDRAIGFAQNAGVVVKPRRKPPRCFRRSGATRCAAAKTFGMLLQPFDAEQFRANGRLGGL